MTGLGWTALGVGGVAIAALVTAVVLALRISTLTKALTAMDGARAQAIAHDKEMTADLKTATDAAADARVRYERTIGDLRRDVEELRRAYLKDVPDAALPGAVPIFKEKP